MNISKMIQQVHENAVNHGWWETDRSISESIVLIHSEWSEAVEEARAGRPMVWYSEAATPFAKKEENLKLNGEVKAVRKPEGIAVELIDGVIRIFDLFGKMGYRPSRDTIDQMMRATKVSNPLLKATTPLVEVVAAAHSLTATAGDGLNAGKEPFQICLGALEACAGMVMLWLKLQGEDPVAILEEKHRYNVTRPYKHGKKF